ncbi:hypothetical protein FGSG_13060 [Fusarium graminearum PH-1]|uniref:hypothetical protein n=1 Tax=Gibberella zeae (strain ATCC MYA-4620 / CBS 123657 / FGSC 9075 / NRRL 31084 / PH-1) TaxID=229533 RepID=UPI00021F125B|nr:hypothetical protein FGSG_13060 [Fusarium graminearum PH-1]ESU13308.1 hypothetical protein FGSG_13060 [Fusarium graminearum PH-1]|eukprot:XP_011326815.1 hypothetical protein FGSG_13060 [Fusarium graminearum PH-1]
MERSRGVPEEEMFLNKPAPEDCDSPTVEPLRIFKPQSPQPPRDGRSSAFRYPAPPSSTSPVSQHSFPLPPGASSSAAPLPFPDDDDVRKPTPAKPFGSAYNDTSPRLETSPHGKKPGLAERRGAAPKPISSPTSPDADHDLFQRPLADSQRPDSSNANYHNYQKTYYPPPGAASSSSSNAPTNLAPAQQLKMNDQGVNRFASTASTSTTRASRGSPPPPETPVVEPGQAPADAIEARYAAAGISGTATLNSLGAPSAAASQRLAQYGNQPPPQRPWTPTETPDQAPSGPPTVYQGMNAISSPAQSHQSFSPPPQSEQQPQQKPQGQGQAQGQAQVSVLEQDFQRMNTNSPPPAYSSLGPGGNSSYPNEKQRPQQAGSSSASASSHQQPATSTPTKTTVIAAPSTAASGLASPALQHPGHPAFANDPHPAFANESRPEQNGQSSQQQVVAPAQTFEPQNPASPPPLPEGWIAHLDQNSGQYYYIHLATQATQWEFPKGPNPISHEQAPLSPTASTYGNPLASPNMFGKQSMASPMFPPHTPGHFDQPFLREAFAQIPHVLQIDDHDIFDGYGSYPDYMQSSPMFKNIGRIATEMYLLFQHHTTVEMLRNVSTDHDIFTITGTGWHFVKYLGPAVVVVGPDCRSERTQAQVMAGPTYQGIFPKVATLPPSVQHCIWMVSVPLVYPRLDTVESLANTMAAGKKAVNTTYNILGKVTSSVAGVVGGKDVVAQGFSQVKKAVGKTGLMGNVLNQFGELDIQEVLKDMWTHDTKDLERTYLIRTLQGISQQKGIRMTFLSGDVNASGAGLVHDPTHPGDHKTMYQIISSPIVAAPQSNYVLKMLHNQKTLYVPQNGKKSTHEVSDTKEDMMEIFHSDASGAARELKKLMGRRNYVAFVSYDQDAAAAVPQTPFSPNPSLNGSQQGLSKVSLAVDFVVQGDGAFTAPTKYGPVIIPHLEYGR